MRLFCGHKPNVSILTLKRVCQNTAMGQGAVEAGWKSEVVSGPRNRLKALKMV